MVIMKLMMLLFFSIINGFFPIVPRLVFTAADNLSKSIRFDVVHMPQPISELVEGDKARLARRKTSEVDFKFETFSAFYARKGQYFVPFKVGTPPQMFLLIPDTGSTLTWMRCRFQCHNCRGKNRRDRTIKRFHADHSSSFRPIPCSQPDCVDMPEARGHCSTPTTPCSYNYNYLDDSWARGFFANETVTVGFTDGKEETLENVLIGCSRKTKGGTLVTANGILGLGNSKFSFLGAAYRKLGGKFSYCFVDRYSPPNISSFLVFGKQIYQELPNMQYTPMVNIQDDMEQMLFYHITLTGISLDGQMLDIPPTSFDYYQGGGTLMDSGTTLLWLNQPAYDVVVPAIRNALKIFENQKIEASPFEFCFNSSIGYDESMVPKLVFHFDGGAQFAPPVKSYVILYDGIEISCIGITSAGWPGASMFGNIIQQNHLWEYDLDNFRLGFAPSTCEM